jgi:hypothetical protein
MDGYVRVSRRMGRGGPGYISPNVQREAIQRWADYRDVEIVAWHVDQPRYAPSRLAKSDPTDEHWFVAQEESRADTVSTCGPPDPARSDAKRLLLRLGVNECPAHPFDELLSVMLVGEHLRGHVLGQHHLVGTSVHFS